MLELEALLERIRKKYDVEAVPLKIGDKVLKVLQIKDYEEYVAGLVEEGNVDALELPFWAKIWDASIMLAYFMGKQPVAPRRKILEIGAGLGIVGIYAALHGHNVVISDINEDALLFAEANALMNGARNVSIQKIDWKDPVLPGSYDMIIGSEVVYDRESYPALTQFLKNGISKDGMIFLAKNAELNAPIFFAEMAAYFQFKQTTQSISADGEPKRIELYAIRLKR